LAESSGKRTVLVLDGRRAGRGGFCLTGCMGRVARSVEGVKDAGWSGIALAARSVLDLLR
jgi:hypothetical protein